MVFVPQVLSETTLQPISMVKIEALIEKCCYQQSGSIAGIIDGPDGSVDAGVGLSFCESETSDVPLIRAIWFGLHPNIRKQPTDPNDPKGHYGKMLFQFTRWCHENLEQVAGHPVLLTFDLATRSMLSAKLRLYQRNLQQVGAIFAFGAPGDFVEQKLEKEATV